MAHECCAAAITALPPGLLRRNDARNTPCLGQNAENSALRADFGEKHNTFTKRLKNYADYVENNFTLHFHWRSLSSARGTVTIPPGGTAADRCENG